MISRGVLVLLAALFVCPLPGCTTSQRSNAAIRRSAERAYEFQRYDEAALEYRELLERRPEDWRAQYQYGRSLMELGDLANAQTALEVAYTLRPNDPDVTEALADVLQRRGDDTRLFAFLRGNAETHHDTASYMRLARYALRLDDFDTARWASNVAIEIDRGQTVEPYLFASDLAQRVDDPTLAVRRLRQAYGINPTDERVLNGLRAMGEIPGPTIALAPGR